MAKSCDGHECRRPADYVVKHGLDGATEAWCEACIPNFQRAEIKRL